MSYKRALFIDSVKRPFSTDFLEIRKKFFDLEKLWESTLDLSLLNGEEKTIHEAHKLASRSCQFSYNDPISGNKIFTRYFHFLNGKCCGEGCRHCTFNFENVPESVKRTKRFNSSFWVDVPWIADAEKKQIERIRNLIRIKPKNK